VSDRLTNKTVHQWAQIEGLRVAFQRTGSGPALVLVHGLLGYSFSWRLATPFLAVDREVFAVDMPGAGLSDCNSCLDCTLKATAQRLLSFLDALGIGRCDLVGSSYGGATVAMAAALAHTRVRTLVLVSPANPWSKIGKKRLAILTNPFIAGLFAEVGRAFPPLYRYSVRHMYADGSRVAEETLRGYGIPLARKGVLQHAVRITQTWHTDMRELAAALTRIADIPVLLVWGSEDRVVDTASAGPLARHFQRVETVTIEDAGHLPYEERPEEFSRMVLKFLARYSPLDCEREVT
jgi:pimeloyl-ACP methyl ester carboxylesterase